MSGEQVFTVGDRPRLDLHVPSGRVEVRTGGPGTIRLSMDATEADGMEVTQLGDTVAVRQGSRWRLWRRSSQIVAEVPEGATVEVATASADVRLVGTFGRVRIRSASGDIEAEHVAGLDVSSASGNLRVTQVDDELKVSTASGDVTVRHVGGPLTASSASGDIAAGWVAGDVEVATTSGDVHIERCDGRDASVRAVSGDITVGLPGGITVTAELSTTSGRTTLPPPAPSGSADAAPGERRAVRLKLRSVSGDLRVERAG